MCVHVVMRTPVNIPLIIIFLLLITHITVQDYNHESVCIHMSQCVCMHVHVSVCVCVCTHVHVLLCVCVYTLTLPLFLTL